MEGGTTVLRPLDYGGFPPNRSGQGAGQRQLSIAGGGGGPPDDPPDDEDEDDDDEGDEEDEEEEEEEDDDRTRRRRRRSRNNREIKNDRPRISRRPKGYLFRLGQRSISLIAGRCNC